MVRHTQIHTECVLEKFDNMHLTLPTAVLDAGALKRLLGKRSHLQWDAEFAAQRV